MRRNPIEADQIAEVLRKIEHQQLAQLQYWEVEREGVWWLASMNSYGGLEIRCVNGDDRDLIAIPSTLVEEFAAFVARLYPDAARDALDGPGLVDEARVCAEAQPAGRCPDCGSDVFIVNEGGLDCGRCRRVHRPAPRPVPPHTPGMGERDCYKTRGYHGPPDADGRCVDCGYKLPPGPPDSPVPPGGWKWMG